MLEYAVAKPDQIKAIFGKRYANRRPVDVLKADLFYQDVLLHAPSLQLTSMVVVTKDLPIDSLATCVSASEVCFKIKFIYLLDTLILKIYFLIIKTLFFSGGGVSDVSAATATLVSARCLLSSELLTILL